MVVVRKPSALKLGDAEVRQLHERIAGMAIERVPTESLKLNPKNAKQHPERQILLIAENMRKFGITQPILIDEDNTIIAGHGRIEAAKRLRLEIVPTIRLEQLSVREKRAVALADNKLAELGSWNIDILASELKELTSGISELSFDYSITGFETVEIDHLLGGDSSPDKPDPDDEVSAPITNEGPVTAVGDLWICGDHRLYCGNALESTSYRALLGGTPANVVFSDPQHHGSALGRGPRRIEVRESATVSNELKSQELIDFLQTMSAHIAGNVVDGAVISVCMDWRHLDELSAATRQYFGKPKNMAVWVKSNGKQGSVYGSFPAREQHRGVCLRQHFACQ